jgi:putative membrane protein
MSKIFVATIVAIAAVVGLGPGAWAQTVPSPDQQFMVEAARGGIAEVELGRVAAQRAATDAVRQFAQRMAAEHGVANQELMQLAQRRGVTLPREVGPAHRAAIDRLSTLSGPAFDQAYMNEMMRAHQQDAALFTREAREGQDAEVRGWAAKTLATINEHQRLAYDAHARVAAAPAVAPPAGAPVAVVPVPPPPPAASPATVTTIVTTTVPAPPFCGGAYLPGVGTNFGSCGR